MLHPAPSVVAAPRFIHPLSIKIIIGHLQLTACDSFYSQPYLFSTVDCDHLHSYLCTFSLLAMQVEKGPIGVLKATMDGGAWGTGWKPSRGVPC